MRCAGKSPTKMEVLACYFLASVYFLVTGIPACYLIMVRCGQGGSKSFRKNNERLARNEAFCGHGLGRNGVWKKQMTLYLQFYGSESKNLFVSPSSKSKSSHKWREVKNRSTVGV